MIPIRFALSPVGNVNFSRNSDVIEAPYLRSVLAKCTELFRIGNGGKTFASFQINQLKNGENMKSIIVSMIAAAGLVVAGSAMATDMPELAKKSGCTACHTVEKKLVGPAWRDVSKAYNKVGATGTAVDPKAYQTTQKVADILKEHGKANSEAWLVEKVSKGGKGDWFTTTAMIPNAPRVSEADIKTLVDFILGLEKK
jgi:cytochrome c